MDRWTNGQTERCIYRNDWADKNTSRRMDIHTAELMYRDIITDKLREVGG